MKNIHLLKSSNGNGYLYNWKQERLYLIHPEMYKIIAGYGREDNSNNYYIRKMNYFRKYSIIKENIPTSNFLRLDANMTKHLFTNTKQITFELTDKCNLACKYCAYRDLYDNYDLRLGKNQTFKYIKQFIKNYLEFLDSEYYESSHRIINIGFYGGEPTLNFDTIEKTVIYTEGINSPNYSFTYSMTTNGTTLNKYIDFFVTHNFDILVSLDGNRRNNMNRVNKEECSSFDVVYNNIEMIRRKYPKYYKNKIGFNAVLHDKNPIKDIYLFFSQKLKKVPQISPLSSSGRNSSKSIIFQKMERNISLELQNMPNSSKILDWLGMMKPGYFDFVYFVYQCMGSVYSNYNELFTDSKVNNIFPSGTCLPFMRKIYVTVNNKILPCERIGHNFVLANIDKGIKIDFHKIANKYNELYRKIQKKCSKCFRHKWCSFCYLANKKRCEAYLGPIQFERIFTQKIDEMERNPTEFYTIYSQLTIK